MAYMKAPHPFPRSPASLPLSAPLLPESLPLGVSFFSFAALLPVPFVIVLYGVDGLILPATILGEHPSLAFVSAAIAGLFLGLAARERKDPRRGLLALGILLNLACTFAAFCHMFKLHEIHEGHKQPPRREGVQRGNPFEIPQLRWSNTVRMALQNHSETVLIGLR